MKHFIRQEIIVAARSAADPADCLKDCFDDVFASEGDKMVEDCCMAGGYPDPEETVQPSFDGVLSRDDSWEVYFNVSFSEELQTGCSDVGNYKSRRATVIFIVDQESGEFTWQSEPFEPVYF